MPAFPIIYTSAPNQVSNQTSGWTSKTIYSYCCTNPPTVGDGDNILSVLKEFGFFQKGSTSFKENYFAGPNINAGRTLKITMHFMAPQTGNIVAFSTGLYDPYIGSNFVIQTNPEAALSSDYGESYGRYECSLNTFYDPNDGYFLQAIGAVPFTFDSMSNMRSSAIRGSVGLPSGYAPNYSLYLRNLCGNPIRVFSLTVEEIG